MVRNHYDVIRLYSQSGFLVQVVEVGGKQSVFPLFRDYVVLTVRTGRAGTLGASRRVLQDLLVVDD